MFYRIGVGGVIFLWHWGVANFEATDDDEQIRKIQRGHGAE